MPYFEPTGKGYYPDTNPYKTGDTIKWKSTGEIMTVGDDFGELYKWYPNGDDTHIVTTSGRVLHINEIEPA